ncbi:MAG TPA: hypothetical protein VL096_16910 [Pirellulaceae bacterium]|nr:hypothetical protein [Pirellulaceae bacterium]
MPGSWTGIRARKVLEKLRVRVEIPADEHLEVWGPKEAYQYDASGTVAIQEYVTLLMRRNDTDWYFVRQISSITNGHKWPSQPTIGVTSELEARRWLTQNNFTYDRQPLAAPARSNFVLGALLPWL